VVFAERDESSGIRVLERLSQRELRGVPQFQSVLDQVRPQLEYDDIFARKMKGRAVVLGHVFLSDDPANASRKGMLPPPVLPEGAFGERKIGVTVSGHTRESRTAAEGCGERGHINPLPDTEVLPAAHRYSSNTTMPTTSRCRWRGCAHGNPRCRRWSVMTAVLRNTAALRVKTGPFEIPVDDQAGHWCPIAAARAVTVITAGGCSNERIPVEELKGKIALVARPRRGCWICGLRL
jgi:adenylate cyclase